MTSASPSPAKSSTTQPHAPLRILVLGGGFTGLRTAYLLHRQGHRVTIVERATQLGGMVGSHERTVAGRRFLFDFGPHLFFREYLAEYRSLIGSDMLTLTGRFTMCTADAVLSYPLRPLELFSKLGPLRSAACVLDYLAGKIFRPSATTDETSLRDSLTRRFGGRLFRDFYAPYIVKCCGLPVEDTDILWAKERENVSGRSLASNLLNKIRAVFSTATRERLGSSNDPSAAGITAWYPRLGSGQLCKAMASALEGADIHLNTSVVRVDIEDNQVRQVIVSKAGLSHTMEADLVISTIPLPHLISILEPVAPAVREASASLRFRAVRLVNLIVDKPRVLDSLELFSMDPAHLFKRVYEPKAMSPDMAPPDMTSLCLEVCCTEGDAVSQMKEDEVVDSCVNSLIRLGLLDNPAQVKDSFLVNLPEAYPIYRKGFEQERSVILDEISKIPNLITCGRQGIFRYHSMTNEVMETADSIVRFVGAGGPKAHADNHRSPWGRSFF